MSDPSICAAAHPSTSPEAAVPAVSRLVCGRPLHHEGAHGLWKETLPLTDRVELFMSALRDLPPMPGVFNPWRDVDSLHDASPNAPHIRASNLRTYLNEKIPGAKMIMVGEAPGYRGGKFSGIAMTSERILLGAQAKVPAEVVFKGPKYRTSAVTSCEKGFIEPTASIVWSLLLGLGLSPLEFILWNAFPCHPFKDNAPLTNRKPSAQELQKSAHILKMLIALAPQATLVAVGRVAEGALESLGLTYSSVRHPAMGGANDFRAGVRALLKRP